MRVEGDGRQQAHRYAHHTALLMASDRGDEHQGGDSPSAKALIPTYRRYHRAIYLPYLLPDADQAGINSAPK